MVFEADNLPAKPVAATEVGGTGPEAAVRRSAMRALASVRGKESETFKALAKFVRGEGPDRTAAIRAIGRIPSAEWPVDEAEPTLKALLAYIKTDPSSIPDLVLRHSTPSSSPTAWRGFFPPVGPRQIRRELGELGVRVIRLGTVTDQMLFDKDRIAAQAGKPVEVLFENTDIMPHNFVVTRPGALEEVGLLGESSSTQPGALERDYVPTTDKILVASRLLAPRRIAEDPLHRAERSRGSIPMSAPIPATGGGCTARSTSSRTSPRYLADPDRLSGGPPPADPRRPPEGQSPTEGVNLRRPRPRRSRASTTAGRSPTASRCSRSPRSQAVARATG